MAHTQCIDDEILAAYFDGLLTEAQEQTLHQKALACARCREQLLLSLSSFVRPTICPVIFWFHPASPTGLSPCSTT